MAASGSILILGSRGQLGRHLHRLLLEAVAWDLREIDLTDTAQIRPRIVAAAPKWVINAAAYTAVDKAEGEEALAYRVNAIATAEMAKACHDLGAGLIHFSTDYVFDGRKPYDGTLGSQYRVGDPANPINAYGRTKLAGEAAVREGCEGHWIFRTSWLFSEYPGNFLTTMLRLGTERRELGIVADQYGKPTFAGELARLAVRVARGGLALAPGTYHASCPRAVSWYEFAEHIFEVAAIEIPDYRRPNLRRLASDEYRTLARRPANGVLFTPDNIAMTSWTEFLPYCVKAGSR